ncbi:MAG: SGNH/GDSL hydrolase family protein [Paracoccaceae bacterium]
MRWRWPGAAAAGLVLFAAGLALQPMPVPRDVPLPHLLPDGPLRITVFGTSLTAPPQTWPDDLAARLEFCRKAPVTITRVAGPGMGSAWALDQVGRMAATAPDLALIEFAINDADLRDGVSLATARAQHRALIADLRAALPDAQFALMTMNPAHGPRGWIRPRLAAHYAQYHDLALTEGMGLIDLYPRWLARARGARGLDSDGLHPDPAVAAGIIVGAAAGYHDPGRKCL